MAVVSAASRAASAWESDARLANRLAWVTGLRLAFLSILLGGVAFFYLRGALGRYPQSQTIILGSIGSAFALAAAYATALRSGTQLKRLAETQIVLDQLTWTAIVYVSGGATSGATSFYGLTCLVGAILVGMRGAAIAAVSGIVVFASLCTAFVLGWIRPPIDQSAAFYAIDWEDCVYPLLLNSLGIVVVALLAGYLAERLRRTGGALEEANERALAAERLAMLGRIAAGLAHEIRNPLGSISGSIEMLREAPGLGEEDRLLCDIIQREANRLNNLVGDMMDLAKPKKPEPGPCDVVNLAKDVVALAARSERSGAGDVKVTYVGPDAPIWARCDGAQMRQVVWNLVRNGVQASPSGTTLTVTVEDPTADRVLLVVTDQGPGISEEDAERMFEAFYTTREHGAGIGLAVVRRIVDDHRELGVTLRLRNPKPVSQATENLEESEGTLSGHGASFEVGLARCEAPSQRESAAMRRASDTRVRAAVNSGSRTGGS